MSNTVFFKKQNNKYVPVSEYDPELIDALPYGTHIQVCKEHGMSRRYNVDPALAPMVAASMILEDKLATVISAASSFKLEGEKKSTPLTLEQKAAWDNLNKAFGGRLSVLYGPSHREIAESILKEIAAEAEKLLTNDALREQYEHFLLLTKLTQRNAGG